MPPVPTIVESLGEFAAGITFESLPPHVVGECKRVLLDSVGCALAGVQSPKGRIGVSFGTELGALDRLLVEILGGCIIFGLQRAKTRRSIEDNRHLSFDLLEISVRGAFRFLPARLMIYGLQ